MATKAQLKEYFKSQKIPTEAQFGTLIDSLINLPSTDIIERPNQNLFFGNGEENPYIQGIRTISKDDDGSNGVVNMWIFSTYDNNDGKLAIPMFILMRTSTKNPGLLPSNNNLRYCIPDVLNIETFVQQGVDCNTSTDDDIFNVVYNWQFKPFGEGGSNQDTFKYYRYVDAAQQHFYNFIFEIHTVASINGYEITIPTRITEINGSINIDTSYEWILMSTISLSDVEVEWNDIKDNLDNINFDIIVDFRNQWYKQANK